MIALTDTPSKTAVLSADNSPMVPAADSGATVEAGTAPLTAAKSVDKSRAKVGDTLTYTITLRNARQRYGSLGKYAGGGYPAGTP